MLQPVWLIEVNGKIVLTKNRDDLSRLLAAAPDPAQIVVLRKIPAESRTNINQSSCLVNGSNAGKGKEVTFLRTELEVLREKAEEAQKTKDGLISDNIRLTHRISYLEEQVSELLCRNTKPDSIVGTSSGVSSSGSSNDAQQCLPSTNAAKNQPPSVTLVKTDRNVTNINIMSSATPDRSQTSSTNNDLTANPLQTTKEGVQVFQKGSQVTALVANLPGLDTTKESHTLLPVRSKSSMSNVSNTHIPATQQKYSNHNTNNNNNKDRSTDDSKYHNCHNSNNKSNNNGTRHSSNKHRSSSSRSRHQHGSTSLVNSQNNLDQSQEQLANGDLGSNDKVTYRKHHHHHHHREKDYNSETSSTVEQITRYNKRNMENGHRHSMQEFNNYPNSTANSVNSEKDYTTSDNLMDQSFKKATKIVHELTRNQNKETVTNNSSSLYEKHRQKCITASEKYYNSDLLKHYNARKSTSVLDFRSEIHIGPNKYEADSKSAEELDVLDNNCTPSGDNRRLMSYTGSRKVQDCRSVKSLDFDSDCASSTTTTRMTRNGCESSKNLDYTSEPILENYSTGRKLYYYGHSSHFNGTDNSSSMRPRPTPPKKPLRLSLHKTQSLQSVETPTPSSSGTPSGSPKNTASAKNYEGSSTRKRTYKGEATSAAMFGNKSSSGVDSAGFASSNNRTSETTASTMKWTNHFAHHKKESSVVENGSWC